MLDVAAMNRLPDIERIKDLVDRDLRLQEANEAVGRLRVLTASYRELAEARARTAAAKAAEAEIISHFSDDLEALLTRYLEMRNAIDPHQRWRRVAGHVPVVHLWSSRFSGSSVISTVQRISM